MKNKKFYKIYKVIHDNPIEVYMTHIILLLTVFILLFRTFYYFLDNSHTYNFIIDL